MIIKSNSTFSLVQTITDSILLIVNGTYSQPVLRCWHISEKEDALYEWNRITSWDPQDPQDPQDSQDPQDPQALGLAGFFLQAFLSLFFFTKS